MENEIKSTAADAFKVVNELPIWHMALDVNNDHPDSEEFKKEKPIVFRKISPIFPLLSIQNVLSSEDCQKIIAYGKSKLGPSTTIKNKSQTIDPMRTSFTAQLTESGKFSPLPELKRLQLLLTAWSYYPVTHMESINLTYYPPGTFFKPHYDFFYFEPTFKGPSGERILTFFAYLNTLDQNQKGQTCFPKLDISVRPIQGNCLFWPNTSFDGQKIFHETFHEGQEVLDGEKWALNIWMRQYKFI